jgi:DNA-binding response OmpR family regulator
LHPVLLEPFERNDMPRILIHEPDPDHDESFALLAGSREEVVVCRSRESLVASLTRGRPDVLVYVLEDLPADLGLLTQLRRVAPTLPIILLGGPTDLASRRAIQELKPTYYGVFPLEGAELGDAVRGVLHRAPPRP